jgi:hypothetical protein
MIHSKNCFKCQTIKPLTEFYKHSAMLDGHLNKCKICTKNDVAIHRLANINKIRQYDKERSKLPERKKLNTTIVKAWRQEDNKRQKCHNAVSRAIKRGILVRMPCIKCNSLKSLAHHENYNKPLDVMWLCQICHKDWHKHNKAIY